MRGYDLYCEINLTLALVLVKRRDANFYARIKSLIMTHETSTNCDRKIVGGRAEALSLSENVQRTAGLGCAEAGNSGRSYSA